AFSGGNGDVSNCSNLREPAIIVRPYGFFVKEWVNHFEFACKAARHRNIAATMKIEGDIDIRANGGANGHRPLYRNANSAVGINGSQGGARIQLQRQRAQFHNACRLVGGGSSIVIVPARPAIDLHLVTDLATQHAMDGLSGGLAVNIPER